MLGEQSRDRRRDTTATRGRQHEVPDLHDLPLGVEVMERAAADDLAALCLGGRKRQQAALLASSGSSRSEASSCSRSNAGRFPASRSSGSVNAGRIPSTSSSLGKRNTTPRA